MVPPCLRRVPCGNAREALTTARSESRSPMSRYNNVRQAMHSQAMRSRRGAGMGCAAECRARFLMKMADLRPRVRESASPRVRESASPRVRESASPRVRESASPRVRESASPRVRESASPRVRESASPRVRESEINRGHRPVNGKNAGSVMNARTRHGFPRPFPRKAATVIYHSRKRYHQGALTKAGFFRKRFQAGLVHG